jgi:hypothetical protein
VSRRRYRPARPLVDTDEIASLIHHGRAHTRRILDDQAEEREYYGDHGSEPKWRRHG